jgi:transposase-like protein
LGINLDTLYTWISKDKNTARPRLWAAGKDHDVEIERLQKELHEDREEIEILQDALGFFVKRRKK